MPELVVTTEIEEGQVFLLTPGIKFSAGKTGPRTFKGVAYSGEVITDQGYWDKVAFDVSEIKFSHKRMPTLRDHDPGKILGFTTGFDKANDQLTVSGVFLENSPEAQEVVKMADEGYPWQMSVNIIPEKIQVIEGGETAVVNGKEIKGPAHIFRKSTIREVSFCAVGADRGTSATIFSYRKPKEVAMKDDTQVTNAVPAVVGGPDTVRRDLAIQALSDEKNMFSAKVLVLEGEKASLTGQLAETRAQYKSTQFELESLKESLAKAREEVEALRKEKVEFTRSSRVKTLAEAYGKLGLKFDANIEPFASVIMAEENVFQAFLQTFGMIKRPAVAPPEGAFDNLTPAYENNFSVAPPAKTLADIAKERSGRGVEAR